MFSFTIPEFVFLCAGVGFVGSLVLFPSFRKKLGSLVGGFLQIFVQDMAKTPDGAKAIYAQKIDEMQDKYNQAESTLKSLAGQLKMSQDNYALHKKRAEDFDSKARAAMSRGDRESATIYARNLQDEKDEMNNYQEQYEKLKPLVEDAKLIVDKIANDLINLKRESKNAVAEMTMNNEISEAYSKMDELKATTGTDKMLNATREGLQDSRERAAGAKVVYNSSRKGRQDKADAKSADYAVEAYLDSISKSSGQKTYNITDVNAFTKPSSDKVTNKN